MAESGTTIHDNGNTRQQITENVGRRISDQKKVQTVQNCQYARPRFQSLILNMVRSRQTNSSGRTARRRRTGRRRTPDRTSVISISSGAPVNANGRSPGRQTRPPAPYTRRNVSLDPDLDLYNDGLEPTTPTTPEREFDPEMDLPDYEDTPGRTASNGVLPPLVGPMPPPVWDRSIIRNNLDGSPASGSPGSYGPTSPDYGRRASSSPGPASLPLPHVSPTSPNDEGWRDRQPDSEEISTMDMTLAETFSSRETISAQRETVSSERGT